MWPNVVLVVVLIICVVTDINERKIYNKVVFPALLMAWIGHGVTGGWYGLKMSIAGFLVGLGILLIPFVMGGMGAGDVKLLALVGALKGTVFVLTAALYMALIGAGIALVILLCRKSAFQAAYSVCFYLYGLQVGLKVPVYVSRDSLSATYPYGIAIAGGGIAGLFGMGWGIG